MTFHPSRKFKCKYNQIFRQDPEAANLFLLLAELADKNGKVKTNPKELADLMAARFDDFKEYAL